MKLYLCFVLLCFWQTHMCLLVIFHKIHAVAHTHTHFCQNEKIEPFFIRNILFLQLETTIIGKKLQHYVHFAYVFYTHKIPDN